MDVMERFDKQLAEIKDEFFGGIDPTCPDRDMFNSDAAGIVAEALDEWKRRVRGRAKDKIVNLLDTLAQHATNIKRARDEATKTAEKELKEITKRINELQRLGADIDKEGE